MKRITRVLVGGTFVVLGCGCFLYPNFREWNTQREVNQIIEDFDETFSEGLTDAPPKEEKKDKPKKDSSVESKKTEHVEDETEKPSERPEENTQNQTKKTPGTHYDDDSAGDSATAHSTEDNSLSDSSTEDILDVKMDDHSTESFPESSDKTIEYRPYQSLYDEMVKYNDNLSHNGQSIFDAWSYEQEPFDLSQFDIDASNPVIGYIDIPDMGIRLPLMLGASPDNLRKGAAVLSETSMPIGGYNTNCVIAGHRGWNGSAFFQYIENMKIGSEVYVTNPWETMVYKCTGVKIIDPNDVSSILIQPGKDMITLFTCHPYVLGGGPYRYLAFCERVDTQKRHESEGVKNPDSEEAPKPSESLEQNHSYVTDDSELSQLNEEVNRNASNIENTEEDNLSVNDNISNDTNNNSHETNDEKKPNNIEKEKEETNVSNEIPELPDTEGVVPADYFYQQGRDRVNLLALEQTLRYMLPIVVIAVSIMTILFRNSKPKKSKKKKKKKRKRR